MHRSRLDIPNQHWLALWTVSTCLLWGPATSARSADIVVSDSVQLQTALYRAMPGDRILIAPGDYRGGISVRGPVGTAGKPILVTAQDPDRPPVFQRGGNGMHLSGASHVELRNLIIRSMTTNGINIDDAGDLKNPARGIVLRDIVVQDIGSDRNQDAIKFSGVDEFLIENCTIERWGYRGHAIDLVGCHDGQIAGCTIRSPARLTAGGVQMKGGSSNVTVRSSRFDAAGERAVCLGGSTGLAYFRPKPQGCEAKDLLVEHCTFSGSEAPVAFVGVDGAVVRLNTIYRPGKWVFRILQETREPGFVACRNGSFTDNIVAFDSSELQSIANIGPNTSPESFQFARNSWYCIDRPSKSKPQRLPTVEVDGIYGVDPLFADPQHGDFKVGRTPAEMREAFHRQLQEHETRNRRSAGVLIVLIAALTMLTQKLSGNGRPPHNVTENCQPLLEIRCGPRPPTRAHFAVPACLAACAFTYFAFLPLHFRDMALRDAFAQVMAVPLLEFSSQHKASWLGNFLAFVPLGWLWYATATLDRCQPRWRLTAACFVLGGCLLLAASVEFVQLWLPDRMFSQNAVLARLMGTVAGIYAWHCCGQFFVDRLRNWTHPLRPLQPLDWFLRAYFLCLCGVSAAPFDFRIQPVELYEKFNSEMLELAPFASQTFTASSLLSGVLLLIPLGAFVAVTWTPFEKPIRSIEFSATVGCLIVSGIECLQFFEASHSASTTDVITGAVGVAIGTALMSALGYRSPVWSPLPVVDFGLRVQRWTVASIAASILATLVYMQSP